MMWGLLHMKLNDEEGLDVCCCVLFKVSSHVITLSSHLLGPATPDGDEGHLQRRQARNGTQVKFFYYILRQDEKWIFLVGVEGRG